MDILYDQSKINLQNLKRITHQITSYHLSELVEVCKYPELKKHYYKLLQASGLTDSQVKAMASRYWGKRKESKFLLHKDHLTLFYIFLSRVFIKEKDLIAFNSMITFIGIRYYTNKISNQIKHCNPKYFRLALENISKTHLFSREGSISNAIYFLSKELQKKYSKKIKDNDLDGVSKFIVEYRSRIAQSIRKFAEVYFKISKEGSGIKEPYQDDENEHQYDELNKSSIIINNIVNKITIHKHIDIKAKEDARKLTKISASISTLIVRELSNIKYQDQIRVSLELFFKDLKEIKNLCSTQYFQYLRKLISTRKNTMNLKRQIHILTLEIINQINYMEKYNKLTKQTRFSIDLFIAYYITMILRNTVCKLG